MSASAKPSRSSKPGLKMKELVEATGVPKSTILHYLNQGLLLEPVKTSPNMAYYDPGCVDRIRYIQHLQQSHRLSLSEIKQMLAKKEDHSDFSIFNELATIIFGRPQQEGHLNAVDFCLATGLTRDQLKELLRVRLLLPVAEDSYDPEDVSMGKMYARGFEFGVQIQDMAPYVALFEKIVDHEMAFRRRLTHHLPYSEDAAVTIELVKFARMGRAYVSERLFQQRVAAMKDLKEEEES